MVKAPAAMNTSTKMVSTIQIDRPVNACTWGRPVTSGVTSSASLIRLSTPSRMFRMVLTSQSMIPSMSHPMSASAPDDALDDFEQDRGEHGQAVADQRV